MITAGRAGERPAGAGVRRQAVDMRTEMIKQIHEDLRPDPAKGQWCSIRGP